MKNRPIKSDCRRPAADDPTQDDYYRLAALNNEIINKQRLLAQENAEINELLLKKNTLNRELRDIIAVREKLLAILAHDIRTPLSNVVQIMNYVLTFKNTDILYENNLLSDLKDSAQNTLELVQTVLDWSSEQTAKIAINREEIDLKSIVEKTAGLYQIPAQKKGIALTLEYSYQGVVAADSRMISTILRNLLSNAIKFSYRNSEIKISVYEDESDGSVNISVRDTGKGIPEDVLGKLFDINEKVTAEGTEGEKGAGAGLFICNEFANAFGGRLTVNSVPQVGSVFTLSVPRA